MTTDAKYERMYKIIGDTFNREVSEPPEETEEDREFLNEEDFNREEQEALEDTDYEDSDSYEMYRRDNPRWPR